MEPAGLALGVVGLAGLFSACQSAVETFRAYQTSKTDSHAIDLQFRLSQQRFEEWGRDVGLAQASLGAGKSPSSKLDEPGTEALVRDLLDTIRSEMNSLAAQVDNAPHGAAGKPVAPGHGQPAQMDSKRNRLRWAFLNKTTRTEKVAQFQSLVEMLYTFIPPSSTGGAPEREPSWAREFRESLQRLREESKANARRDLHSWLLGSRPPNERYLESLQKHIQGTCDWIFDQPSFQQWASAEFNTAEPKLRWIHGPPGFGKTVLCARIAQKMMELSDRPVAHFFFTTDLESRGDPFVAARSWISQIASQNDDAFETAQQCRMTNVDSIAGQTVVLDLLGRLLRAAPGCTLLLDGLDECTYLEHGDSSVTTFLHALGDVVLGTKTRLLIVSRDEPDIRNALADGPAHCPEHRISPDDVHADTVVYAKAIVDRKLGNKSEIIRSAISTTISDRCEGQFLWIKLQEQRLRKGLNQKQLQASIDNAPTGLHQLYDQIWKRIEQLEERDKLRVFNVLRWAAFCLHPLTIREIAETILLDDEDETISDEDRPDEIDEDYIHSEFLDLCGSLIEVKGQTPDALAPDKIVRLSHFTVKQYMLERLPMPTWLAENSHLQATSEQLHHSRLAKACLTFLSLPGTWDMMEAGDPIPLGPWSMQFYAAYAWAEHMQAGLPNHEALFSRALGVFDKESTIWQSWKALYDEQLDETLDEWRDAPDPLSYALFLGLDRIALALIQRGGFVQGARSATGETTFAMACLRGPLDIVEAIIDHGGADILTKTDNGWTPLHMATKGNNAKITDRLVQLGADLTISDKHGWTPLHLASSQGSLEAAQCLLKHGASVSAVDTLDDTPLHIAAAYSQAELARVLLSNGADVNLVNVDGSTPLHMACSESDPAVVRVLIDHGASHATEDSWNRAPLAIASDKGHVEVVRVLLESGANVATCDILGNSPLHRAIAMRHVEVAKLLLDARADLEARNSQGWTPLSFAMHNGDLRLADMLKDRRARLDMKDTNGESLLHIAAHSGQREAVKYLLDTGADINIRGARQRTPLYSAAATGEVETVELLLDHGADFSLHDEDSNTALGGVASRGDVRLVNLLLDRGADIDAPNILGLTPLIIACGLRQANVVKVLLQRGANASAQTADGYTALNAAVEGGDDDILEMLLDGGATPTPLSEAAASLHLAAAGGHATVIQRLSARGFSVTEESFMGYNPLHAAAENGRILAAALLLGLGVDPQALDDDGRTPVHFAAEKGHLDMVKLLLDDKDQSETAFECQDKHGRTPLHFAALAPRVEVISYLLDFATEYDQKGGSHSDTETKVPYIDIKDHENYSALDGAILGAGLSTVKLLLERGATLPAESSKAYCTLLHRACFSGDTELFRLALESCSVVPSDSPSYSTLLRYACVGDDVDVAILLLEKGDSLEAGSDCLTPLHGAVVSGGTDVLIELLCRPASDPNAVDLFHRTPLFAAARYGFAPAVAVLLEDGRATVDANDWYGSTPLWAAIRNGHYRAVKLLLPHSDISAESRDIFGHTMLWWAEKSGNPELIQLLSQDAETTDPYMLELEDRQLHETPQNCFDINSTWCDVCTLWVSESLCYKCRQCVDGETSICRHCFALGFRCRDKSHEMVKGLQKPNKVQSDN